MTHLTVMAAVSIKVLYFQAQFFSGISAISRGLQTSRLQVWRLQSADVMTHCHRINDSPVSLKSRLFVRYSVKGRSGGGCVRRPGAMLGRVIYFQREKRQKIPPARPTLHQLPPGGTKTTFVPVFTRTKMAKLI